MSVGSISMQLLSKRPEIGFTSSFLTVLLSSENLIKDIGTWLGIFIAIITAILKIMEFKEKLDKKKEDKIKSATHKVTPRKRIQKK